MPNITIPEEFKIYFKQVYDDSIFALFEQLSSESLTTIRVNTLKTNPDISTERLNQIGYSLRPLPFSGDAYQVTIEPRLVSKTLEHFLGHFYIQSPASMLPPIVLDPKPDDAVLDIAAAPGSKTTQLAQMMNNQGMIAANEWDGKRIKTLSHNLDRIGVLNSAMINMAGERIGNLVTDFFDKALVDAPCSALGVIHKAPQAVQNISRLSQFAYIQERLLISAIKSVKPGGTIVYSTCTIAPEENEQVVQRILRQYPVQLESIQIPGDFTVMPGFTRYQSETFDAELEKTVRVLPNEFNPESFYIAKFTKKETIRIREPHPPFANPHIQYRLIDSDHKHLQGMIEYFHNTFGIAPDFWRDFMFLEKPDEILITSKAWRNQDHILNNIFTHRVGMRAARMRKANEWKLSTNLAQVIHESITSNRIELIDLAEIQTFLDGGIIHKSFDIEKGGVVVFGMGYPLGCGVIFNNQLKSQMPKSRKVIGMDSLRNG